MIKNYSPIQYFSIAIIFTLIILFYFDLNSNVAGRRPSEAQQIPIYIEKTAQYSKDDIVLQSKDKFNSLHFVLSKKIFEWSPDVSITMNTLLLIMNFIFALLFFIFGKILGMRDLVRFVFVILIFGNIPIFHGYRGYWQSQFEFFSPNNTVWLLLLPALILRALEHRKLSMFLLGLGVYVHAVGAIHLFILLMVADFCSRIRGGYKLSRTSYIQISFECAVFIMTCIPYIVNYTSHQLGSSELYFEMIKAINWRDAFPRDWTYGTYVRFAGLIYLTIFFFTELKEHNRKKVSLFLFVSLASCFLSGLGFFAVEILQSKTAALFMATRSTRFAALSFVIIFCVWLDQYIQDSNRRPIAVLVIVMCVFSSISEIYFFDCGMILICLLQFFNILKERSFKPILILGPAILVSFSIILFSKELREISFSFVRPFFIFALISICFGVKAVANSESWKRHSIACLLFVFAIGLFRFPEDDRWNTFHYFKEVQIWIKQNAAGGEAILTPPWMSGFRIFSERSPVFEWQDGTQQYFDHRIVNAFIRRSKVLGFDPFIRITDQSKEIYNMNLINLRRIQKQLPFRYYVVPQAFHLAEDVSELPVVFENVEYKIIDVQK